MSVWHNSGVADTERDSDADFAELLPQLFRRYRLAVREHLGAESPPMHQIRALRMLVGQGPMRSGELASCLGIAPRSATAAIDGLQEHGLITRQDDPVDRRARVIVPTPQAHAALALAQRAQANAARDVVAPLSEADRAAFARLLREVTKQDPHTQLE